MKLATIKILLKKYYAGETSLEEEKILKKFFLEENVPKELNLEQVKFKFYDDAKKEQSSKNYKDLTLNKEQKNNIKQLIPLKKYTKAISLVAASFLLITTTYFYVNEGNALDSNETYGTYKNPELAYVETKKALLLISKKLNKGTKKINTLSKLNKVQELLTSKK